MGYSFPILLGYIGPGGGIGLLGPLIGVISAVVFSLLMTALWPIRMMIKRMRNAPASAGHSPAKTASHDES